MEYLLQYLILIPLAGLLLSFLPKNKQERLIFGIAIGTIGLHILLASVCTAGWFQADQPGWFYQGPVLYHSGSSEFSIDFFMDRFTVAFGAVACAITFMVSVFSRYYMHREQGFKRFYSNLLFFYLGLNVILLAGNFETLFIGWEVIGAASFFLIAFYRDRYLPVKNALKVVSLYRLADIFMLFGIWLCHHIFEKSITFQDLSILSDRHISIIQEPWFQLIVPAVFLLVALVKSAQFPFSSWLPRAMEGPTTSSAIFYGSLSVHIGVFLMLRTWPFWSENLLFKGIVILLGLLTTFIATQISRVQSTVKTQIAYSSIAQIGIMFVEVALGFHTLALVHFAGNAFLRTYQLLVSPSVMNYLIHDQFFNFIPPQHDISNTAWGRWKLTLYVLALKEWNLDTSMHRYLWKPLKRIGVLLNIGASRWIFWLFVPIYIAGLYLVYHSAIVPNSIRGTLPMFFSVIGLLLALRAFVERRSAFTGWILVIFNQLFVSLSIAFNEQFSFDQVHLFLSGVFVSGIIGFIVLRRLVNEGESVSLDRFHGHSYERPRLTTVFLIASLGMAGFPITPTFIGEDLMFSHIHDDQYLLGGLMALGLILDGLAIYRIYARVFLGPHERGYHEVAYRSS